MSKGNPNWIYAALSKMAKEAGGPEKLADNLIQKGIKQGRLDMIPVVGAAVFVGALSLKGLQTIDRKIKEKRAITNEEIETAKAEFVQAIEDYDNNQPLQEEDDQNE